MKTLTLFAALGFFALSTADAACTLSGAMAPTRPDARYTIHGNGTVTDTVTGLMWMQCSEGQTWNAGVCNGFPVFYTWAQALARPATVNGAGYAGANDWRVPNIKELHTLVEQACTTYPTLNQNVFPASEDDHYWSSTFDVNFPKNAHTVWFATASDRTQAMTFSSPVRLVRGGP